MAATGFPKVIRIGPADKRYVYRSTSTAIKGFPVYQCQKAAEHWSDTEGKVLYLLPWCRGWKAVHHREGVVPGDVNTGDPVFCTYENAVVPGKFPWQHNTAGKGEEERWEDLAVFETVVLPGP